MANNRLGFDQNAWTKKKYYSKWWFFIVILPWWSMRVPVMPPTANHTVHSSAQHGKYKRRGRCWTRCWTRWERDPGSASGNPFPISASRPQYLLSSNSFSSSLLLLSSLLFISPYCREFENIHFIVSHIVIDDDQRSCGQVFSTFSPHQTLRARRL